MSILCTYCGVESIYDADGRCILCNRQTGPRPARKRQPIPPSVTPPHLEAWVGRLKEQTTRKRADREARHQKWLASHPNAIRQEPPASEVFDIEAAIAIKNRLREEERHAK